MSRQQLLVQGVAQDIRLALLSLPVGVAAVAVALLSTAAAILEVIAVGRGSGGAGLTLGREPVVVEGRGVEPRGAGGGGARRFVVGMIGEDGAEDGGGGGVVVVGVVGMVEGHFLGELVVVVVVLEGHDCVNDDEAVSRSCLYTLLLIFSERGRERERERASVDVEVEGAFISFFTF